MTALTSIEAGSDGAALFREDLERPKTDDDAAPDPGGCESRRSCPTGRAIPPPGPTQPIRTVARESDARDDPDRPVGSGQGR